VSTSFDPTQGLIIVRTEIAGPGGSGILRLALDTGATKTLINAGMLLSVGLDPALSPDRVHALGKTLVDFPVICHTLPPSANVDGLLGLDFIRGQILHIDFQSGQLHLEQ
jgi:hypothetical protein